MSGTKGEPVKAPPDLGPTAERRDPLPAFVFKVTFTEVPFAGELFFRSVSGIGYDIKTEDTREGGGGSNGKRLPGPVTWSNLSFKRGFTQDPRLLEWCNAWANRLAGQMARTDGTIALVSMDPKLRDAPIYSWKFKRAFPAKLSLSEFDASKGDIVIESLDLAHEGLELEISASKALAPAGPSGGPGAP